MKITALVGVSGSGKSYQAISLAKAKGIFYIIDDGLLIKGNQVLGGYSAKREKSILAAVKRALFEDPGHQQEVVDILKRENPEKILVIGTSDKMVERIVDRLCLPPIHSRCYIEELVSAEEILLAKKQRTKEGKHVIPVPTFQIKKHFSGYFLNPLKVFRYFGKGDSYEVDEKSVVRPTFSYLGKYTISDKVIKDVVFYEASKINRVEKVNRVELNNYPMGIVLELEIIAKHEGSLKKLCEIIQQQVKKQIEEMTSLNVLEMNVYVKSIVI